MGFTSDDDLVNQITVNGKYLRRDHAKITGATTYTAGGWHSLYGAAGYPNAGVFQSTQDLVYQSCWETSGDGATVIGIQHGGILGGAATKHAISIGAALVAAAGAPWRLKLVDLQGYYRLSTTNVTGVASRVLINTNTFTASSSSGLLLTFANDFNPLTKVRFTTTTTLPTGLALNTDYYLIRISATTARVATTLANAIAGTGIAFTDTGTGTHTLTIQQRATNGIGLEAHFVVQTAPTAGGPNLSASSYTNDAGVAARAFQGGSTMGAAVDAYATRILHSGNAAGRYGPFLMKQGADVGIRSIDSFTWSAGTAYTGAGVVALCLVKPIFDLPLPVTGMFSERDLRAQMVSLPKIDEGACLGWLLFSTGATTANSPIDAALDVCWGG